MNHQLQSVFKSALVLTMGFAVAASAQSESFCSVTTHSSSNKVTITSNKTGKIGNIGYELWDENGNGGGNATFYDDGSMDCNITNAKDYLCRAGLSLGSSQTYDQLGGDMIAEFKLIKTPGNNVQYSYIGVYGWMENVPGAPNGLVEYYVIDNTLSQYMPGDWIGDTKLGDITVDGAQYTVYRNTRNGPAITIGNGQFYQYFSVRKSMRDCGTINISEHMRQWEKKGLKMGKLYEAKVLGEAGNTSASVSGSHMDFPYAKVYVSGSQGNSSAGSTTTTGGNDNNASTPVVGGDAGQGGNTDWGNMDWGNMDFGNMDWGNMGGGDAGQGGNGGFDWGNMDWGNMDWGNMGGGDAGQGGNGGFDWGNMDFGNMDWGNMGGGDAGQGGNGGFDWGNMGGGDFNIGGNDIGGQAIVSKVQMNSAKTLRVFSVKGRFLGNVELQPGTSLKDALFAKFGKTGVYMVKAGSRTMPVKVSH